MKALGWTLVGVLVLLVLAVLYSEYQSRAHRRAVEAQIRNLAVSVERLATSMERFMHEQQPPLPAPIIVVHGDPSIGTPIEKTWKSGTDTIIVKTYKQAAAETGPMQYERSVEAEAAAIRQYPPN